MRTADKVVALLIAGLALLPATAAAQGASPDPGAGSPAGTVYELPLDSAREDAAPRDRPDTDRSGARATGDRERSTGGGSRPRSALRSENGFGSSSTVPGADDRPPANERQDSSEDAEKPADEKRSDDRDRADAGGAAGPGGGGGAAPAVDTASAAGSGDDGSSSEGLVYGLLGLVLAVGLAVGLATRSRRGSSAPT